MKFTNDGVKTEMEDPRKKFDTSAVEKTLKYKQKHIQINTILKNNNYLSKNGNPYDYDLSDKEKEDGEIDFNRVYRLLLQNDIENSDETYNKVIEELEKLEK